MQTSHQKQTITSLLIFVNNNILLILFILGFLIYGNGLINNFVLDDFNQIISNPLIHSPLNIFQLFMGSTFSDGILNLQGNYYRPVMTISYLIIYSLVGPTP